jgi:phage shock protein C
MPVFCHRCGTGLPSSSRFCSNCGTVVTVTPPIPSRPLYRPIIGRQIAGVCAALAQTYGWDVALVRIFSVIGFFFSGGMVAIAYLACWIGIPEEPVNLPGAYPPSHL